MTQISAMTIRDKLLIVGGTEGQLICKVKKQFILDGGEISC